MEYTTFNPLKSTLFFSLFLLIFTLGCATGNTQPEGTATIKGTISPNDQWKKEVYLVRPDYYSKILADYEMKVVQTISLDENGEFKLEIEPDSNGQLYFLLTQKANQKFDNYLTSFPWEDNYIALHLFPGNTIELESQVESLSFSNRFLKADPTTASLQELHHLRQPLAKFIQEEYENTTDKNSFSFNIHGNEEIERLYHQAIDAFLDTCNQVLPLFVGLRMREPDNEFMDHPEFFISIKDKIMKLAPNHPWNGQLDSYFQVEKLPLLKGEPMPDFTLPSYQGDSLRLTDLKGKLILVDFWASWCAPCRKETRNTLVPLYAKYKDKGFEIAGISIDADEEVWRKAIEKDQAFWLHGCDFMGDESPIRESLRFVYIPSSYLLDENGLLLERNLHGTTLEKYVADYFSE